MLNKHNKSRLMSCGSAGWLFQQRKIGF